MYDFSFGVTRDVHRMAILLLSFKLGTVIKQFAMKLHAYPWGAGLVLWLRRSCYRPCIDLKKSKTQWRFWLAPGLAGRRVWAAIPSSPWYPCSGLNVKFKSRGSQLLPTGCTRIRFWPYGLSPLALGGRYHHCHGLRSLGKSCREWGWPKGPQLVSACCKCAWKSSVLHRWLHSGTGNASCPPGERTGRLGKSCPFLLPRVLL